MPKPKRKGKKPAAPAAKPKAPQRSMRSYMAARRMTVPY